MATSWLNASIFTTCWACGDRFTLLDSAACAAATIWATCAALAVPLVGATVAAAGTGAAACAAAVLVLDGVGSLAVRALLLGGVGTGVVAEDAACVPLPWPAAWAAAAKLGLCACGLLPAFTAAPSGALGAAGVIGRAEDGGMAEVTCRL